MLESPQEARNLDYDRYAKAILSALLKLEMEEPDLSDIWVFTSIPEDLIRELLEKGLVNIPDNVRRIKDNRRRRILYERKE